jgi:hypothetical protein
MEWEYQRHGENLRGRRVTPLVLALCVLGAPAAARADEQLTASGSLTFTFAGDPARGCAAKGLCSVRGTITVDPQGGDYTNESGRPHQRFPAQLDLNVSGIARVQTATTSGAPSSCVDVLPVSDLLLTFPLGKKPQRVTLGGGFGGSFGGTGISSGVCAGPLEGDLNKLAIPIRESRGKHPSFDLRTRKAFTAGPFSGELVSTLDLTPDLQGGFSSSGGSSSSGSGSSPTPPRRTVLVERIQMRYRLAATAGALQESFSGAGDPFCQVLDACGVSGTSDLTLRHVSSIDLSASRIVRRVVSRARAIADLRAGKFSLGLLVGLGARVSVAEKLQRPDATVCRDVRTVSTQLLLSPSPGGLDAILGSPAFGTPADALRTHCPGPSTADVFGSGQGFGNGGFTVAGAFAQGSLKFALLGRRILVVALTRGGRFSGFDYSGSRGGAVLLTLARTQLRAGTVKRTIR